MQSPSSNGSRPHSNSSVQSERGPRTSEDVCIGEEVRISLHLAIERFRRNEELKGIVKLFWLQSDQLHQFFCTSRYSDLVPLCYPFTRDAVKKSGLQMLFSKYCFYLHTNQNNVGEYTIITSHFKEKYDYFVYAMRDHLLFVNSISCEWNQSNISRTLLSRTI